MGIFDITISTDPSVTSYTISSILMVTSISSSITTAHCCYATNVTSLPVYSFLKARKSDD